MDSEGVTETGEQLLLHRIPSFLVIGDDSVSTSGSVTRDRISASHVEEMEGLLNLVESELKIGCDELSRKHPQHSLAIRRLALRDSRFREICQDYGEALRATEAYRAKGQSQIGYAEELRQTTEDLRAEALDYLSKRV